MLAYHVCDGLGFVAFKTVYVRKKKNHFSLAKFSCGCCCCFVCMVLLLLLLLGFFGGRGDSRDKCCKSMSSFLLFRQTYRCSFKAIGRTGSNYHDPYSVKLEIQFMELIFSHFECKSTDLLLFDARKKKKYVAMHCIQ